MFTIALLALSKVSDVQLETNILSLLPYEHNNPLIEKALKQQQKYSHNVIFLVSGKDTAQATDNAKQLVGILGHDGPFHKINLLIDSQSYLDTYKQLLPYRFQLLSTADAAAIQLTPRLFIRNAINALYSPLGIQRTASLAVDPLFTFGDYLQELNQNSVDIHQDIVVVRHEDHVFALVSAEMEQTEQTLQTNEQLVQLFDNTQNWAKNNNLQLYCAGLPLYNAFGAIAAKRDISSVGFLSVFSIIFLILYCFRSIKPLLLALASIGAGVASGFTACIYLFPQLHIITLVFGSSLIGVSIDYAFHYFSEFFNQSDDAIIKLKRIFPGITLGMLSSVLAYSSLIMTPFPGLQQIAVFSAVGLMGAWVTVILLFPFALSQYRLKLALPFQSLRHFYKHAWPTWFLKRRSTVITILLLYSIIGLLSLNPIDDIRKIEHAPEQLLKQEEKIKSILDQKQDSQLFIVRGSNIDNLLSNEAALVLRLDEAKSEDVLSGYKSLATMYPDSRQQQNNYQTLRYFFETPFPLNEMLTSIGMADIHIKELENDFRLSRDMQLGFREWLDVMPPPVQDLFLGCDSFQCASIVTLNGIKNLNPLIAIASSSDSIIFVDQVATVNQILLDYRKLTSYFLVAASLVIVLALSAVLGLRSAVIIMCTPAITILLTIATLTYLHSNFSLFNVLALLLVVGISLDYAIFSHLSADHEDTTTFAILLSALTTLLAFGLLALSSTMVVHAFGLTLAIGITLSIFVASVMPRNRVPDYGGPKY